MTNAILRVAVTLKFCPSLANTVVTRAQLHMEIDTAKHLSTFPAYHNTATVGIGAHGIGLYGNNRKQLSCSVESGVHRNETISYIVVILLECKKYEDYAND